MVKKLINTLYSGFMSQHCDAKVTVCKLATLMTLYSTISTAVLTTHVPPINMNFSILFKLNVLFA